MLSVPVRAVERDAAAEEAVDEPLVDEPTSAGTDSPAILSAAALAGAFLGGSELIHAGRTERERVEVADKRSASDLHADGVQPE